MKVCNGCGEAKALEEYYLSNKTKDGHRERCKKCISIQSRKWREENKEKSLAYSREYRQNNPEKWAETSRKSRIKYTYNITYEQYEQMLEEQNHVCAICKSVNKNGTALSIDHNHNCCPGKKSCGKCIRQLLCNSCNAIIGHAKDKAERLEAAIEYIHHHTEKSCNV